jgi:hypothetical protein
MAWPTALTTNGDILKHVFSQGITRNLESGNDFTELHNGVSDQVRNELESRGTPDADAVTNTSAFVPAAANLFASLIYRDTHADLSASYFASYLNRMKNTRVEIGTGDDARDGGLVGRIVVRRQGTTFYTTQHPDRKFPGYRGQGDVVT